MSSTRCGQCLLMTSKIKVAALIFLLTPLFPSSSLHLHICPDYTLTAQESKVTWITTIIYGSGRIYLLRCPCTNYYQSIMVKLIGPLNLFRRTVKITEPLSAALKSVCRSWWLMDVLTHVLVLWSMSVESCLIQFIKTSISDTNTCQSLPLSLIQIRSAGQKTEV